MKPLRVPAVAALVGAALLLLLFPRTDPSAAFGAPIDRGEAVRRARQLTARYGVPAADWKVVVTQLTDEKLRAYLSKYPDDPAARLFAPLAWGVLFTGPAHKPGRNETVRVKLLADGRPLEWELKQDGGAPAPAVAVSPETALQDFAGSSASSFKPADQESWTFPMVATLTLSRHDGRMLSAVLSPVYARSFRYKPGNASRAGAAVAGFLAFAGFCVAFVLAVRACFRGWLSWRVPAGLVAALAVWSALMMWAGADYQTMRYGRSTGVQVQVDDAARKGAGRVSVTTDQDEDNDVTNNGNFGSLRRPGVSAFPDGVRLRAPRDSPPPRAISAGNGIRSNCCSVERSSPGRSACPSLPERCAASPLPPLLTPPPSCSAAPGSCFTTWVC